MTSRHTPFHPIIYVRGFAATAAEIDDTSADPFCGFNLGSTVYRAVADKNSQPRKHVFESPIVRLASDFRYRDVYEDGYDILDPEWSEDPDNKLTSRSIVIHRYYDPVSRLFSRDPKTPSIETFSERLGALILRVRELVCANRANRIKVEDFRCYLVAHSMGGLVCRGLLQNPQGKAGREARACVDKFFTYATPHNGIEVAGVNVPTALGAVLSRVGIGDVDNFSRERMAGYLDLATAYKATGRVDWMPEKSFPPERVFCMVGTNRLDYEAAAGASRTFVGHGSDGLVRIENATLCGLRADGTPGEPCAKAFAYRAHSGFYGIVNSEEAYQNLTRFLFGDVRVDVWIDIDAIRLPSQLQEEKIIDALYQFEVVGSPRGKLWYLTRRIAEEDSVACLRHADWTQDTRKNRSLYVSTVFLANRAKVNPKRRSLAYSLTLGVRVPDYEVKGVLWTKEHYEGGYLFRKPLVLELIPPAKGETQWSVKYAWQDEGPKTADEQIDPSALEPGAAGKIAVRVPFASATSPGISGQLRFVISAWNRDARMVD